MLLSWKELAALARRFVDQHRMRKLMAQHLAVVFLLLTILWLVQDQPAHAEISQPDMDTYIEEQLQELRIPGLAIAIVRGDQIAYLRGYGTAGVGGRPVTPQTPFLIASMSKSFTALGIMQLVEAGKLRLDAPVQEYLPWFEVADSQASSQVTVRQLLYQTSGFSELEGYERNLERDSMDDALEMSVRRLSRSRLSAAPGERFEYSNTNYDILGLLIQTVSGMPYETYIEEKIFAPLRMQNSFTSLSKARAGRVSSGYIAFFGMTLEYDRFMPYSRTVTPSAGLFASAEDMAHYLIAHLNQGRSSDGAVILSPESMEELHLPGVQIGEQVSYAMGWTVFPFPDAAPPGGPTPTGISHGGEWANFKSLMLLIPEQELGVAILMNKTDQRRTFEYENIAWNTALLALGLEPAIFSRSDDFMTQYGQYVGMVVVLVLLASFIWSIRRLFPGSSQVRRSVNSRQNRLVFWALLPLLDLVLAGYILFWEIPQSNTTLMLSLSFNPEVGLLYLVILIFTLGWGALRTLLAIRQHVYIISS
jgi:CubicO group peptidase (beta-lactamase class C family)